MRLTKWQRLLNYILVIVLFFSGICFEAVNAESAFSYAKNSTKTCSLQVLENTQTHQDICTSEQLKTSTIRCAVEKLNRAFSYKGKAKIGTGLLLSILNTHSGNSNFYFKNVHIRVNYAFISCKAIIISYIHHQDGAK